MRRAASIGFVVGLVLATAGSIAQQTSLQREDELKAGYVLNFAKFVDWPSTVAADSLTICVAGASGVYDALKAGDPDKRIGSRRLLLKPLAAPQPGEDCDVLYLGAKSSARDLRAPPLGPRATLTVSDAVGFTREGGIIELFTDHNRLRFIINVENAKHAGLHISSSLLKLALVLDDGAAK